MTVLEAIKQLLIENKEGLTYRELTEIIIQRQMYSFNTLNPSNIVNHELRKHCVGLDFPSAHPMKYFAIVSNAKTSGKAKYQLIEEQTFSTNTSKNNTTDPVNIAISDLLPIERIAKYHSLHFEEIQKLLLEAIQNNPPAFFESLVVELLLKLGYGYDANSGKAVGKSHDGGIDGIINEDMLGLDRIYIQAKRYSTSQNIGRPELQAFAGAMMSGGVKKGVFITTSTFTKSAKEFTINQSEKNISLIDGDMLTRLMIEKGVGIRTVRSFDIYEIDTNFFSID